MAANENRQMPDIFRRLFTIRNGSLLFVAFCVGVTFVSVGITAALAAVLGDLQNKMGPLGQIFESVNTVFSGLGFIALVVTFRLQYDELRLQRQELESQRHAMNKTQKQLRRSAEADIRARHVELMRMSMEDCELAEIWPEYRSGLTVKINKQFVYANLVVQHQRMLYNLGVFGKADVYAFFRYAFTNQIMRDFWEARMIARQVAVHRHSAEWKFDKLIDRVYKEALLAGSRPAATLIEPAPESDAA